MKVQSLMSSKDLVRFTYLNAILTITQ